MKCAVVIILLTIVSLSNQNRIKVCGKGLVEALQLVCGTKGYHTPWWTLDTPQRKKYRPMTSSAGVVYECCLRTCSLENLAAYCADPALTDVYAYNGRVYKKEEAVMLINNLNMLINDGTNVNQNTF